MVQPGDNKLVVAGVMPTGKNAVQTLAVTRLLPTGAYDAGFGTGGTVVFALPSGSVSWSGGVSAPAYLALQSDGKIVVVAGVRTSSSESKIVAMRLTPTGMLDTTFGASGPFSFGHQAGKLTNPLSGADQTALGDLRMIEGSERARLAFESRHPLRVVGQFSRQDFEGDVATELRIPRPINLTHSAGAYGGDDFVGPETRALGKGDGGGLWP